MPATLTIHPVPVRKVEVPKLWYQGNPVKTHFFNALSTQFPQGENFFVWSIQQLQHQAKSPNLKRQIEDFTTQEWNHAAVHRAYNRCLSRAGYNVAWMETRQKKKIDFAQDYVPPLVCLAITVATEHVTAVLGEKVLAGELVPEGVDPELRKLWIWHSLEEVDHKSVAMDLFVEAGGTYFQRFRAMIYTIFGFSFDTMIRMFHMLKRDGLLFRPKTWWQIAELLFAPKGLLALTALDILGFFAPSFHPARQDHHHLVARGRELLSDS